jgi:hypothetical protein
MSATIEDRLEAALEARAELVTSDDLRPLAVPDSAAHARRRTVIVLSAAAAAVVAIAAPFVIARLDGSNNGSVPVRPPVLPPPTNTAPTNADDPADGGRVVDRQQADVDGDGRPDDVRLLVTSGHGGGTTGAVDVTLASGATASASWPTGYPPRLLPAFDINGDGHEQVLLSFTAGGDEAPMLVYTWLDDGLVRARIVGSAPLALGLDGEGTYTDYYTDVRGLHSWLRGEPVQPGGWPMFHAQDWVWTLDGDQLTARPDGDLCIDATASDPPSSCD